MDLVDVMCIYFFCYGNQTTVLNVLDDVTTKTENKVHLVVKFTFYIELFTYILIIFLGYFSTYEQTPEIFINRQNESTFLVFAKLFYCCIMVCDIALEYYTCKSGIEWTLYLKDRHFTFWENLFCATVFLLILMCISFEVSVTALMGFVGATSQVYLMFIIPCNNII